MSWDFYFNMERMSLDIAKENIELMTDDNKWDDVFLDQEKLLNNLKHGFVAITQLSCFIESLLNTIINSCMDYDEDLLLKCSIKEKLDIISLYYKKTTEEIKGDNCWNVYLQATKVRNEMIHHKKNFIGFGGGVPDFKISNQNVSQYFVKANFVKIYDEHIRLARIIAKNYGLLLFEKIDVFECAGRDGLVNYIYDENITDIDEDRFK